MRNIRFLHVYSVNIWTFLAILTGAAPLLFGAETLTANRDNANFKEGVKLHDAARQGKAGAVDEAIAIFKTIIAATPKNSMARAYLGSSYAIKGRDSEAVANKVRFTNRGLRYMDEAVKNAPNNFAVRLIRVSVASNLPAMFGRRKKMIADMLALDKIFQETPNPRYAQYMVNIYQSLEKYAPKQGDWKILGSQARSLAKGSK